MARESEFKVGDAVVKVGDNYQGVDRILMTSEVVKVGVRKVVLKNGQEWLPDGSRPLGHARTPFYSGGWIRLRRPGDTEKIRHQNLVSQLGTVDWGALKIDLEDMEAIWAIANKEVKP